MELFLRVFVSLNNRFVLETELYYNYFGGKRLTRKMECFKKIARIWYNLTSDPKRLSADIRQKESSA